MCGARIVALPYMGRARALMKSAMMITMFG